MKEDTVVALPRPGSSLADDPLLAVLREGARRMQMQAIEAEVEAFLATHAGLMNAQGRRRLVRNGHAPERQIQTGIGPLAVRRPKVRDRGAESDEPIRFTSAILPAYLRRARNIEELLPSGLGPIPRRDVGKADRALPQRRVDRPVRGGVGCAARA